MVAVLAELPHEHKMNVGSKIVDNIYDVCILYQLYHSYCWFKYDGVIIDSSANAVFALVV